MAECFKYKIPKRVITSLMGCSGIAVGFGMRLCLSIAITEMVIPLNQSQTNSQNHTFICSFNESIVEANYRMDTSSTKFDWNQELQGWILSSFYIGYIISHIPGGMLAQRLGGKITLSLAVLLISACTIASPISLQYYDGPNLFIALRIIMGLAAGIMFPALTVLVAAWVPARERSKLGSIALGGSQIGSILSLYVSGIILSFWPWPFVFHFWGIVGIIWLISFSFYCYDDPASHPYISNEEREYLKAEIGQLKRSDDLPPTPWTRILTNVPIWAFIVAQMGQDWTFFVMSTDLPKFMKEVLGFSVHEIGLYTSLPNLLMLIISIISAFLCDHLIVQNYLTITQARKMFTILASVPPAIFIVAASYAGCNKTLVVFWFILALGFMGFYYCSLKIHSLDLSPNYAGPIAALTNGAGSITGVVAPVFVGMMTPESSPDEWRFIYWFTFGITIVRVTIYLIWGSAEIQQFNDLRKSKSPECDSLTANSKN